jgi:hypothetical protein
MTAEQLIFISFANGEQTGPVHQDCVLTRLFLYIPVCLNFDQVYCYTTRRFNRLRGNMTVIDQGDLQKRELVLRDQHAAEQRSRSLSYASTTKNLCQIESTVWLDKNCRKAVIVRMYTTIFGRTAWVHPLLQGPCKLGAYEYVVAIPSMSSTRARSLMCPETTLSAAFWENTGIDRCRRALNHSVSSWSCWS